METIVFLLVAGAVLMLLEPLFPHLVAGAIGLMCWCAAVLLVFERYGQAAGTRTLAVLLVVGLAGTWFYFLRLPDSRVAAPFRLEGSTPSDTASRPDLLDQRGIALTPLRPGGTVQIGAERVDVVTSGEPLERGQAVLVIAVEGSRVVVRAV